MKFGLVGKTLKHSFSKIIHEMFLEYEYDLIEIEEKDLKNLKNNEYLGFNVTIPYKKAIIPFCDVVSDKAQKIGSVNTVIKKDGKMYGYNTDYAGFYALSKRAGINFFGKKVAILGSGGTYNTAYHVVLDNSAKEIISVSRNGRFNYNNIELWNDCEIIINTTPVGMYPDNGKAVIDVCEFQKLEGVIDVIYNPINTKLVFDAKQRGLKAQGGLYMLVYQAKEAFEIFTGKTISDDVTEKVYKKLLDSITNIVLVGMPGSGKSVAGKMLSQKTGKKLVDLDKKIEEKANMPIPEIFQKYGEDFFRKLETECAKEAGNELGKIISCGGGIVTRDENLYPLIQNGKIIRIKRDLEKLDCTGRPLSSDIEKLKKMEEIRSPMYEKFSDFTVENNGGLEDLLDNILNCINS